MLVGSGGGDTSGACQIEQVKKDGSQLTITECGLRKGRSALW